MGQRQGDDAERVYTTHDVARLCRVTPMTVIRWIEDGKLPAFKTAGGHRRVLENELRSFLRARGMPQPEAARAVLIVDVDEGRRDAWTRATREVASDWVVESATDAFEAGYKLARVMPALTIVDVRTPGLDPVRVCARLRDRAPGRVVVTGVAPGGERRLRECGASEVVAEGAPASVMVRLIRQLLKQNPPS
jgi:excisionase family DNA binding protein